MHSAPSPATIRPARPGDLDALVELCAAHAAFERAPYRRDGKAEALGGLLFADPARLHALVAERDETILGYATWTRQVSTWDAADYAYMDCLFLVPEARGAGIGRRLVARLASDALAAGCQLVQWQTPTFNTRALPFYAGLGASQNPKVRFFLDAEAMEQLAAD